MKSQDNPREQQTEQVSESHQSGTHLDARNSVIDPKFAGKNLDFPIFNETIQVKTDDSISNS
jgi:hypothetical protein